jgi:membrane-associated phospholipid phosphatase
MDSPASRAVGVGWLNDAGSRLRVLWLTKMIGTLVCMTAFFIAYFWLLNHPRSPITVVPRIFIDRMIGFHPGAILLYISIWVYVPLLPALLASRQEVVTCAWAGVALSIVGFGIFILWPTAVPKPDIDWKLYPSLSYLKAVDASGNAFPSLHVAFAVFAAAWFDYLLRAMRAYRWIRALNLLWCVGIVYSTLAIRQHVALDAVAGALLGGSVAFVSLRRLARLHPAAEPV